MLTAVVTHTGPSQFSVVLSRLPSADDGKIGDVSRAEDCEFAPDGEDAPVLEADGTFTCGEGPSPILPEMKELAWGAGSFILFALLMRFLLFPMLKKGMDARQAHIAQGHIDADVARSSARDEVVQYEAALAAAKAEANSHLEAARATLEAERQERLATVNARLAEHRAAAAAEAEAAREAVRSEIESAIGDVAASAVERAVGRRPDDAVVSRAVTDVMSAGAGRNSS